jgi:hypothetical protein
LLLYDELERNDDASSAFPIRDGPTIPVLAKLPKMRQQAEDHRFTGACKIEKKA